MSYLFKLRGGAALSSFRLEKLLDAALDAGLPKLAISAEFWHFAQSGEALSEQEQAVLAQLLTYGAAVHPSEPEGELFLVTPRLGTLSPWASKASDIAQHCGLEKIRRI
ncbi:hypothetical protein, partial [Craterilacuibacter sp.]|uniref:hypothetical protein n=1 Tax=Craterilacuibacter sp. TaxID=2870909 RepID=UPI003F303800